MSRRDRAIVAWHEVPGTAPPKEPSRRVRCDSCRRAHRFDGWSTFRREIPLGLAAPDHTVPYGTVLSRDAFPGTSCQATTGAVPTGRLQTFRIRLSPGTGGGSC